MKISWHDKITMCATVTVALVACLAYKEYNRLNSITLDNMLYNMATAIYDIALKEDKEYVLTSLYSDLADNETQEEYALRSIRLLMAKDAPYTNINQLVSIKIFHDTFICRSQDNDTATQHRILNTLAACERILYLVYNAYIAKRQGLIDNEDWQDYISYIDNYGSHIVFLSSIYIGHRYGYFSVQFAEVLQKRLIKNKVVEVLYPEMLKEEWLKELKERRRS